MNKSNHNNKPDLPDPRDDFQPLIEIIKKSSVDLTPQKRVIAELAKRIASASNSLYQKQIEQTVREFAKVVAEQSNNYSWEEMRKTIIKAISSIEIEIPQKVDCDNEIDVDFSDQQLSHIEELNIDINEFADNEKSLKNKKFFTKETVISLIGLLIAILTLIQQSIPDDTPEKEVALLEEQNKEIKKLSENTEELIELLQNKLNSSTLDETAEK